VRTAFGVAILALLTVLMAAASHDQQAAALQVPVDRMTGAYRVAVAVVPGAGGGGGVPHQPGSSQR
jgi:hypothetical protein